jgi:hypothetical protein
MCGCQIVSPRPVVTYPTPPKAGALIGVGRSAINSWILRHGLAAEILPHRSLPDSPRGVPLPLKRGGMKVTEVVP